MADGPVLVWALTALPQFFTPTEARAVRSRFEKAKDRLTDLGFRLDREISDAFKKSERAFSKLLHLDK